MMSQGKENGKNNGTSGITSLNNMYVSKSLNTPRYIKKPTFPESPKNKSKKKSPRPQATSSEASGAAMGTVDNTAVFFISPASDVKEEVLRYYEINKRSPSISKNQN